MKLVFSAFVGLSLLAILIVSRTESTGADASRGISPIESDAGRDKSRLGERASTDMLGKDFEWEKAKDLVISPGDPFPEMDLDSRTFSQLYQQILGDESLSHRDRGTKLELLVKSFVLQNGIEGSLGGLDEFFGPGRIKNRIIGSLFRHADSTQGELCQYAIELDGDAHDYALDAIFSRIPGEGYIDSAIIDLFPLPEKNASTLCDCFLPLVASKAMTIDQGVDFMSKAYGKEVSNQRMTDFLRRLLDSDGEGVVHYCLTEIGAKSQVRDEIIHSYLSRKTARSANEGMNTLLRLRDKYPEAIKGDDFAHAMGFFLEADRRAALQLFNENKNSLPGAAEDTLHGAVSLNSVQHGEFKEAWQRLDQIDDPVVRQRFEDQIWAKESRIIAEETERDPAGFVDNLTFGGSPHAQFWIKKGFRDWYQQSPNDANSWFAENQSKMNPDQSQHIARAYAEVALEQGDVALAREWSARVVDPEFKQKLVDQIKAKDQEGGE